MPRSGRWSSLFRSWTSARHSCGDGWRSSGSRSARWADGHAGTWWQGVRWWGWGRNGWMQKEIPVHDIDVEWVCPKVDHLLAIFSKVCEVCWEDGRSDENLGVLVFNHFYVKNTTIDDSRDAFIVFTVTSLNAKIQSQLISSSLKEN